MRAASLRDRVATKRASLKADALAEARLELHDITDQALREAQAKFDLEKAAMVTKHNAEIVRLRAVLSPTFQIEEQWQDGPRAHVTRADFCTLAILQLLAKYGLAQQADTRLATSSPSASPLPLPAQRSLQIS